MATSLLQTRIVDKIEVILQQIDTMNKFGKSIPLIHIDMLKANVRTLYEQICELEQAQLSSPGRFHSLKESQLQARKDERKGVMTAAQTITSLVDEIEDALAQETSTPSVAANDKVAESATLFDSPATEVFEESIIHTEPIEEMSLPSAEPEIPSSVEMSVSVEPMDAQTPIAEGELSLDLETAQEASETHEPMDESPAFRMVSEEEPLTEVAAIEEEIAMIQEPIAAAEPEIFNSLRTIADMYKGDHGLTGESILQKVTSTIQSRPSRDLKSAIGINEKFLFINELFKGNMKEYTDTILSLSESEHYEGAMQIIEPLQSRYQWSEQSVAYMTLIELLQRKFI